MKMKLYLVSTLILLVIVSCDESFDPLGEYSERYVMNCIVKADTNLQVATITQSYLNGIDPYGNDQNPTIDNVYLRLWYDDEVYIFRDTILDRTDTSRYDTPVKTYYVNNLKPKAGSELEIEAVLPNGRRLQSSTRLPGAIRKNADATSRIIPPEEGSEVKLSWNSDQLGLVYHPRLYIVYNHTTSLGVIRKRAYVPLGFYNEGGSEFPIYASPGSTRNLTIGMDIINRVLDGISEGDENKRNYEIMFLIVELIAFDKNLSIYYSSTSTVLDEYSIKLDETDFSNIKGGFGVFGSYNKGLFTVKFQTEYLQNYGYRNGFE
jgi:hypothetical protein